jgi:hypothetical protein
MSSPALLLAAVPGLTSPLAEWQVTAGYAVFAVSYLVFAVGKLPGMKIDRPGMAIIGAVLMVASRFVPPPKRCASSTSARWYFCSP